MPVAAEIDGQLYAIEADHLHTPRRLSNAQGQGVWQWITTGFGEMPATHAGNGFAAEAQGPSLGPAIDFPLRYPGQVHDVETGLFYNHHRYYDPYLTVGYTQADPIGLEGGWNRFAYAGGNPVNLHDPDGLSAAIPFPAPVTPAPVAGGMFGACLTNPWACGATISGVTGYTAGSYIYPYIAIPLGDFLDWCMESRGKESRRSQKERATDIPSFAKGQKPNPNENCDDFAARILVQQYGEGDPRTKIRGSGSEYQQIKKNCERGY